MATPKGVRYVRNGSREYQLFPEEYFSSCDIAIYFGDVWLDDIVRFQFTLQEMVQPVFGYASKTWDYVMRGRRQIQGTFSIAFREAGYLYTVFDHIGQLSNAGPVAPSIAYMMQGLETPKWYGGVQTRIEEAIANWHTNKAAKPVERKIPRWNSTSLKSGMQNSDVKELQYALYDAGYYDGNFTGIFDDATIRGVKAYQAAKGYQQTGIADSKIRDDLSTVELVVTPDPDYGSTGAGTGNGGAEPRMLQYESDIWGRSFVEGAENARKFESYFYRGRTSDVNGLHTKALYQQGIDIYLNYGPLPEFLKEKVNQALTEVSFNTTVRALRNVQIFSIGQIVDSATGQPIEEVYQFIAKDLD